MWKHDFLQSANYLNNSDEGYSCEKCSKTFASEKFLQIHSEATHKEKCTECDFETGHKEIMKEHLSNPGILHRLRRWNPQIGPMCTWSNSGASMINVH